MLLDVSGSGVHALTMAVLVSVVAAPGAVTKIVMSVAEPTGKLSRLQVTTPLPWPQFQPEPAHRGDPHEEDGPGRLAAPHCGSRRSRSLNTWAWTSDSTTMLTSVGYAAPPMCLPRLDRLLLVRE